MINGNWRKITVVVILCAAFLLSIPQYLKAVEAGKPRHGEDGWETSLPEAEGMDPLILEKACEYLKDTDATSFMVLRHNRIITERYYRGRPSDFCFSASAANLLLSALIGISIDQDYIRNAEQEIMEFYPEYIMNLPDPQPMDIRVRHLLTMTSGFGEIPDELFHTMDWVGSLLKLPLSGSPGLKFYHSPGSTYLLSGIISRSTGMSALEFAQEKLFKPSGISNAIWHTGPEKYNIGGDFMYMKSLDMARLGCLYLHKGEWAGHKVIPREWVMESLLNQVDSEKVMDTNLSGECTGFGYGLAIRNIAGCAVYTAEGEDTAPNLCLIPELDVVVVVTSYHRLFKRVFDYEDMEYILREYVIPGVKN